MTKNPIAERWRGLLYEAFSDDYASVAGPKGTGLLPLDGWDLHELYTLTVDREGPEGCCAGCTRLPRGWCALCDKEWDEEKVVRRFVITKDDVFRMSRTTPETIRQSSLDYLREGGSARPQAPIALAWEELEPQAGIRIVDGRHRLLIAQEQGKTVDAVFYVYRDGYLQSAEKVEVVVS